MEDKDRHRSASSTRHSTLVIRHSVLIEHAGTLTTVQDPGRPGLRHAGLPGGGAVDAVSLRVANLIVGNAEDAAALECALVGPTLRFDRTTDVAAAGATVAGIAPCERLSVPAGERLVLSRLTAGAYAYVAVAGGIDVPVVLGGRGTDLRLGFGGFEGRALRAGDVLPVGEGAAGPSLRVRSPVDVTDDAPVRVVDGRDAGLVDVDWIDGPFVVSAKSDRVGLRLDGATVPQRPRADAASVVVLPGTVQLPPDGVPVVLLADAQTLGGYPQIAHVIAADLPRVAQRRPGQAVRFERVTLAEAHRLARRQARAMAFLRVGVRPTMRP